MTNTILKDVTAYISTRGRYFTTLPLAIQGIINQTIHPSKFVLFDDGEHKDLRQVDPYNRLFAMLDKIGIKWEVIFTNKIGQVKNHEWMRKNATTNYVWRLDDDNVPESMCLEYLINCLASQKDIGAVGPLVIDPCCNFSSKDASSLIADIYSKHNIQWCEDLKDSSWKIVEHLYSTFLYRKEAATQPYNENLSRVGHREETMFTHQMFLRGWKLFVSTSSTAITWHYRSSQGGIRSEHDESLWKHDEDIFQKWLTTKNIQTEKTFWVVLNNGLGDHCMFLPYLEEIINTNLDKTIHVACCYPELFHKFPDIKIESIATAKEILGDISKYDLYKLAIDLNWKQHIGLLYRKIYLNG
jgi:hypothetical protein